MTWIATLVGVSAARAQPARSWTDVPAVLASATAPVDAELRACIKGKLPKKITLAVGRGKHGKTMVATPIYGVGHRGYTPEERCLLATVPKIKLPDLPAELDGMLLGYTITAAGAAAAALDAAWDAWRDPASTIASLVDHEQRTALAVCDSKKRTVRVKLDRRKDAARVWLPAWQFHSPKGDGSTPPAEAKVKACINKVIRTWKPPVLPAGFGELDLALVVMP